MPLDFDLPGLGRVLFENSVDAVLLTQTDGAIVRANPAACQMLELDEVEICRRGRRGLIVWDDAAKRFGMERNDSGFSRGELSFRRGKGRVPFPVDCITTVFRGPSGVELGTVVILRDLSWRRSAEADQAHLAAIVATSDDAIISKDLDGMVRSWNAGAERLFGYPAAEMIGQPLSLLIPEELQDEEGEILRRLRAGERVERLDTVRVAKDGARLSVSVSSSPVKDAEGRIIAAAKIVRDVSQAKQAEKTLHDAILRNEQLVAELREALQSVKTLSGLVPVCAWCHKVVRNDDGRWESLEEYIGAHSEAKVSHGICPDCFERSVRGDKDAPPRAG
jgi:PAS domain S-box-containing protein